MPDQVVVRTAWCGIVCLNCGYPSQFYPETQSPPSHLSVNGVCKGKRRENRPWGYAAPRRRPFRPRRGRGWPWRGGCGGSSWPRDRARPPGGFAGSSRGRGCSAAAAPGLRWDRRLGAARRPEWPRRPRGHPPWTPADWLGSAAAASATQKASRQATGSLGIALRYPDFWDRHHATQHDALDEFRFLYKGIQTTRSDTNSRKRNNQLYSISSQQMFHSTKQKLA